MNHLLDPSQILNLILYENIFQIKETINVYIYATTIWIIFCATLANSEKISSMAMFSQAIIYLTVVEFYTSFYLMDCHLCIV